MQVVEQEMELRREEGEVVVAFAHGNWRDARPRHRMQEAEEEAVEESYRRGHHDHHGHHDQGCDHQDDPCEEDDVCCNGQ